jgi:curved DNA-binding protein CbpA
MINRNISIEKSYDLFKLNRSASIDQIKTTYRQIAKKIHPDLNPGDPNARDRFNTLNQAYQLLLAAAHDRIDAEPHLDSDSKDLQVRVNYVVEPILSPKDLQLKQEVFASLEKLFRQDNFTKAVSVIDLLVKVIPNCAEISKKQSEVYFKYAQDLVNRRTQLNLARTYLKASLKIAPHDLQRWPAVNREFNRIERLLQ